METIDGIAYYDVPEISKKLHLNIQTVRRYIRDGQLAASKIGRTYLISEKDLGALLTRNRTQTVPRAKSTANRTRAK